MTQADAFSNSHGADHDHGHDEPHVLPLSTYFAVWGALVVLTVVTVAVSRFDFGAANTVIAMFVATVKATLVALFFMHLLYDNKLNLIILIASMMFVSIFFTPVLIDLGSRGALDAVKTRAGYRMVTVPPVEPTAPPAEAGADHGAAGASGEHGAAVAPGAGAGAAVHLGEGAPTAGTTSSAGAGPAGNQAPAGGAAATGQANAPSGQIARPSGQASTTGGLPSPAKNQPDPGPGQPSVSQPNAQQPAGAHK